ncbi:DUF938 domain-containing protein [Sphingomonas sp. M1-B02]|uniref:DUF938 domain-containing protein n=1 Tax=Sphingomonas sp. M1-B02 TaxID=3114300 RepID=UPI00223F2B2F|nr:DUF938 domain-containing protein [Sphingomonas sp. S6-11]UZK66073.1 class I SAM-dependent methyltransferase [Sphingomonas sp. S6-11]
MTRKHAPATTRNREPIAALLSETLPPAGLVLEVASGSGEHVAFFAERFATLDWQPSDPDPAARDSIVAWCAGRANIFAPLEIDAAAESWPIDSAAAILCINMVHISPWEATLGLMAQAKRLLGPGAPLILYGPFRQRGVPTAESNEAFDLSLRARNPGWGLRHLDDVTAAAQGFTLGRIEAMPANNLTLVYRRS